MATNAPTPRMVPKAVNSVRTGRWVMADNASLIVSDHFKREGSTSPFKAHSNGFGQHPIANLQIALHPRCD